jgi:pSer/pThr/pTyr-binding forkhead associated (FHA) protein
MDVKLKVVQGKQKGHFLTFGPGEVVFGRGPECQVQPDSPLVSRQHCLLRIKDKEVWLRDLGSINGTLVNGALVTEELCLHDGDMLELGPLVLQIILPPSAADPTQTMEEDASLNRTVTP